MQWRVPTTTCWHKTTTGQSVNPATLVKKPLTATYSLQTQNIMTIGMNCKNFSYNDPHWSKKVPDIKSLFVSIGPFQFGKCGAIKFSNHNTYV